MKSQFINFTAFLILTFSGGSFASTTQERLDMDVSANRPIIVHVTVALADNKNQWIVPVPAKMGNGQDSRNNLYWGALYGVKTYLTRKAGWQLLDTSKPTDSRILERILMKKKFVRQNRAISVYLIADAWDGRYIIPAIEQFFRYNAGSDIINVKFKKLQISAGGNAHLIVYVGHNALMDFAGSKNLFFKTPTATPTNPSNDAIVLACKSAPYFSDRLKKIGAFPLVMTHGLMAPEAYSLDSAISEWIVGSSDNNVRNAAAKSYSIYQKTSINAAQRLFGVKK